MAPQTPISSPEPPSHGFPRSVPVQSRDPALPRQLWPDILRQGRGAAAPTDGLSMTTLSPCPSHTAVSCLEAASPSLRPRTSEGGFPKDLPALGRGMRHICQPGTAAPVLTALSLRWTRLPASPRAQLPSPLLRALPPTQTPPAQPSLSFGRCTDTSGTPPELCRGKTTGKLKTKKFKEPKRGKEQAWGARKD